MSAKLPWPSAGRPKSGDIALRSGVYRPEHASCSARDLWIRKGSRLPLCPECGESAAFALEQEVEHISEDSDFQ
jgi:hypothetical protein